MKKFLSLALAVLMLAVMLPITALAAEPVSYTHLTLPTTDVV